ncbi:MAG: hypothetical protein LBL91_05075 [Lachnospiraceae bacterium]|jgi:hypothetical protein|nr:hypothetical protein [Lachnospiraceae bacterium]
MHIKKKTIIKAIISAIIFIVIVAIIGQVVQKNKKYSKLSDFKTVKEFVEYQGSKYLGEKKSETETFSKEVYVRLKCDLYTENNSNEEYFKTLTTGIAYLLEFENFRVIDEQKQIEIAIVCNKDEQKVIKRYINGDDNYYGTQESINQAKNYTEEKITNIQIDSKLLNDVINNNWRTSGVNFGTKNRLSI